MVSSKILIGDAEIEVMHEPCVDPGSCGHKNIFIESSSAENNTLSTITFNDYLTIHLFWEHCSSGVSQEILYVPETGVLFIGCGSISARVSTREQKLIDVNSVALFWSFDRHGNYVLETGEIECFLYSLSGNKIAKADVDSPYETYFTEKGIRFESDFYGSTWLYYSDENM